VIFRRSTVSNRLRTHVIVTLHDGQSFAGVLWEADAVAWVLRNAEAIGQGEKHTNLAVDGEIVIPAGNVAYAQRP
jgi:small nuclear ribonucleoprotein (snRNP)-like protein